MFDHCFVLTLRRCLSERYMATSMHLTERGLDHKPFIGLDSRCSGINGQIPLKKGLFTDAGHTRDTCAQANCYVSHLMLWKVFEHLPGDTLAVVEDDCRLNSDWKEHVEHALKTMPSDWDMLYPGSCCCADKHPTQVSERLHEVQYSLCTHFYVMRRKALGILTTFCQTVSQELDIAMSINVLPKIKAYAILPRVAYQLNVTLAP